MLEILNKRKIHPKFVNLIANIYQNDETSLFLNNEKLTDIKISSGIRQGCNLSALLLILITYKIIESIQKLNYGYEEGDINISSLFYMDDGLIFTKNEYHMSTLINRLEFICLKYGLKLNKNKCKIMIINDNNVDNSLYDIEIVNQIKYLGILIDNNKNCFQSQKNKIFQNATLFNNQIYSILGN